MLEARQQHLLAVTSDLDGVGVCPQGPTVDDDVDGDACRFDSWKPFSFVPYEELR